MGTGSPFAGPLLGEALLQDPLNHQIWPIFEHLKNALFDKNALIQRNTPKKTHL